jgi:hypothetical protein
MADPKYASAMDPPAAAGAASCANYTELDAIAPNANTANLMT